MLDVATKDSMKIVKDRIRILEQKDEVERLKVVAASSGVKRGHAKSTEEAASKSTAKRMNPATSACHKNSTPAVKKNFFIFTTNNVGLATGF